MKISFPGTSSPFFFQEIINFRIKELPSDTKNNHKSNFMMQIIKHLIEKFN